MIFDNSIVTPSKPRRSFDMRAGMRAELNQFDFRPLRSRDHLSCGVVETVASVISVASPKKASPAHYPTTEIVRP